MCKVQWFGILLVLLVPAWGHAQSTQRDDLRVLVERVTDNRSTEGGFNKCELSLNFLGDEVAESAGIARIALARAVDDTGRNLLQPDKAEFSSFEKKSQGALSLDRAVEILNPSRNARTVSRIEGTVDLYQPSKDKDAIVHVPGFMEQPGTPLATDVLGKYGIELTYMTKEAMEQMEKQKAESGLEAAGQKMGEAFGELFAGMFGGLIGEAGHQMIFSIRDPQKRIIEMKFMADGKDISTRWSSNAGKEGISQYGFEQMPATDTELVLFLGTPKSIRQLPFVVENVPLP